MRKSILDIFLPFTESFEGGVPWLYADIRGLITIAFGNLVDPLSAALGLPLQHPDGRLATKEEITHEWLTVKGDPLAPSRGHLHAKKLTKLRLTTEGMQALALTKAAWNHKDLCAQIPDFEELNACAQLAMYSLAWACGSRAYFPKLFSAVKARDYLAASVEIHMNEWTSGPNGERIKNAGLVPRNVANKVLMRNAHRIDAFKLDPDTVEWVDELDVSDIPTDPGITQDVTAGTIFPKPLLSGAAAEEFLGLPRKLSEDDDDPPPEAA